MNIRPLTALSEFEECIELQRDGFGWNDAELMPDRFFVVSHHVGGLVLGAFEGGEGDEGDDLLGFLSTIPGIRAGEPYWHSHMLAVRKDLRDRGIGSALKFAQRDEAIRRGIALIEWTFDPLESRNAYLNIEKLGVVVRRYYPDFYGNSLDRVIAEWWVGRPRMQARVHPVGEQRLVSIPADIRSVRQNDPDAARSIQQRVREQFRQNAADDFFAVGFRRSEDTGEYIFVRGASGVDQAD